MYLNAPPPPSTACSMARSTAHSTHST
jgi:hypothetical protein